MASRIPRLFQRVVYRHRRSISLVYNESRELAKRLKVECFEPATVTLNQKSNRIFPNAQKRFKRKFQVVSQSNVLQSKHYMSTLPNWSNYHTNCIEFETFNHPKIDTNVFEKNLKTFWNFVPKTKYEINKNHIATIEFEHESGSPCYPTIVVNQLHYEKLSKNTKQVIDRMIHTIPNHQAFNPSTNENFLVCGRVWEPITNENFDLLRSESKFAASLSVSGIFPKKVFSDNGILNVADHELLPVMPPSAVHATQACIDLEHVIPSTSFQPAATITFREMFATNSLYGEPTAHKVSQRF